VNSVGDTCGPLNVDTSSNNENNGNNNDNGNNNGANDSGNNSGNNSGNGNNNSGGANNNTNNNNGGGNNGSSNNNNTATPYGFGIYIGRSASDINATHRSALTVKQGYVFTVEADASKTLSPDFLCTTNAVSYVGNGSASEFNAWAGQIIQGGSTGGYNNFRTSALSPTPTPLGTYTFSMQCADSTTGDSQSASATLHVVSSSESEL